MNIASSQPFEKKWMIKCIDRKLVVDSTATQILLNWQPTPRYNISRRLLFILEKMKSHGHEWELKNEAQLKRVARRTNILIYESLAKNKEIILADIIDLIINVNNKSFSRYQQLDENDFQCYMSTLYHLLLATIRSNDRYLMLKYIDEIAIRRFAEGFLPQELCATLQVYKEKLISFLSNIDELKNMKQEIYDNIGLTLQLAQDEIEYLYESLLREISIDKIAESSLMPDCTGLQKMIRQLSAFYQIAPESVNARKDIENLDLN